MEYRVYITDEQGAGIAGTVFFYDENGSKLGFLDVPQQGGNAPAAMVEQSATFHIDSPGYIGYDVLQLADWNQFTLVRENSSKVIYVILALAGIALIARILKM